MNAPRIGWVGAMQRITAAAVIVAMVLLLSFGARVAAAANAELEAAYAQLLRDPTNVELNVRYANLAAQQGDVEAAIGAMERLLLERPDLPQVRLQLGLLYIRLGSY